MTLPELERRESGLWVPRPPRARRELPRRRPWAPSRARIAAPYTGAAASQGARRNRVVSYVPSDVPNRVGHWSMVDSTVSTTASEVTQVNDISGGANHIVGPWNGIDEPDDITSHTYLTRRACQHDNTIDIEDIGVSGIGDTGSYTVALVASFESVTAGDSIFQIWDSTVTNTVSVYLETGGVWAVSDGTNTYTAAGGPSANTPYLILLEGNGASSRLLISGSVAISSMSSLNSAALDQLIIGYEDNMVAQGAKLSWTEALATSDIMASGDEAGLLAWAKANCNV